jgi:titin
MDGKVSLKWSPPEDDGGSPIFNYVLEYRQEGTFQWTRVEQKITETQFTVKKLKKDDIYEFRVAAENKAGVGAFSDNTTPMKAEERITGNAPEVISGLEDQVIVAPNEVVLKCGIDVGEPKASITWYKNGRELRADKKHIYSYEEAEASLTIKLTEPADSANYMCKASNKLGTVDTECSLTVHSK